MKSICLLNFNLYHNKIIRIQMINCLILKVMLMLMKNKLLRKYQQNFNQKIKNKIKLIFLMLLKI